MGDASMVQGKDVSVQDFSCKVSQQLNQIVEACKIPLFAMAGFLRRCPFLEKICLDHYRRDLSFSPQ